MHRTGHSILSFCLIFFMIFTLFSTVPAEEVSAAGKVIVIDPGHDTSHGRGTCKISGIVEESQNLAVAKSLRKQLQDAGYTVYLTHEGSCPVGGSYTNSECIDHRVSFAKSVGCSLFVSIHQNASGLNDNAWRSANGSYIYLASQYQSSLSKLAAKISTNLKNYCGIAQKTPNGVVQYSETGAVYSNGAPADYLRVLRKSTISGFPSLLIEHGYMDNAYDAGQIKGVGAYSFAKADADAIISWFQNGGTSSGTSSGGSTSGSVSGSMAYVNASTLNLRSSASTSSSVVAKLSRGETMTILDSTNGWYHVAAYHGGTTYTGYVSAQYAGNGTPSGVTGGGKAYVSANSLNLRNAPSTGASRVTLLSNKDSLKLFEKVNGWYRVVATHNGASYNGYVSADYVASGSRTASTTNTASISIQSTSSTGTGVVKSNTVNLRSKASTSSSIVTTLVRYDGVDILSKEGNWYKVTAHHGGKTYSGYVCADYISTGSYGKTGYVNYVFLNVRSGCGTGYSQIDRIYFQDKVIVTGTSGNWYQIEYIKNGSTKKGCVYKDYISF